VTGNKVVVRKMLPASREEVFDAWLGSEGMREWMTPGSATRAEVTLDARAGGPFRILMKASKADCDHTSEFRIPDRPSRLQFTWISQGADQQESLVTVEVFDRGTQCEMVLTHGGIPREDSAKEHERGGARS
jgi:uncharacterized protein YndB with AHSA1/START domain